MRMNVARKALARSAMLLLVLSGVVHAAAGGSSTTNVLIRTDSNDYAAIVAAIEDAGGRVTHTYKFVNGLAATVPSTAMINLRAMPGVAGVQLDALRYPGPEGGHDLAVGGTADINGRGADDAEAANKAFSLEGAVEFRSVPADEIDTYYSYAPDSMNTLPIFDSGNAGQGSLIAVIDTGIYADHFMFSDGAGGSRVRGGIDLSTDVGSPLEGATHGFNYFHGTHVAGIAAGFGIAVFPETFILVDAIERYAGVTLPSAGPGLKQLPLVGTAPAADLYAIKVFPASGAGAPTSTIIAGIEHAIDLKVNHDVDVDVINMSLGGGTGYEGRDLESQVVDAATAAGIAVVVSAGNDGPASQTIGSPSGANTAITVGAVAHPVTTRAFWDFNFNFPTIGELLYVDDNPQMIYFSSRGNMGDGGDKPDVSAVGVNVLSASSGSNNPGALTFASGTSMSSPGIAGIVGLLNTNSEMNELGASPYDYKQAVIAGSTPLPGYDAFEQGAGFIDAVAAMVAFESDAEYGSVQAPLNVGHTRQSRKPYGTPLQGALGKKGFTFRLEDLKPGYVEDFYFDMPPNAERIVIDVSDVDLGADPILFNSFELHLMSGMRSTDNGYYIATTNVFGDAQFVVESQNSTAAGDIFGVNVFDLPLMPGHVRLSIENDWTSFDNLSGTFTVRVESGDNSDKPDESYSGALANHTSDGFFGVGFGPNGVELELDWKNNWGAYPSSDMDLIVAWFDTDGNLSFEFAGATLNSPEIMSIDADNIAAVFVLVDAFETYGNIEPWTLNVNYK